MSEIYTCVCSFCGKENKSVYKMVAHPNANICSECIVVCVDLISRPKKNTAGAMEENAGAAEATKPPSAPK